jgi:hypothetical protein
MAQSPAAFGLYMCTRLLHSGAEALRAARFRQTDISVMYADGNHALQLRESTQPEAAVADDGPAASDLLGEMLSELSGIGAIAMRNDGPFMAGGPILATLSEPGHNLLSSLRGLGIPEGLIERYGGRLKQGGLLLSVQCDDWEWVNRARQIFQETGAVHVACSV